MTLIQLAQALWRETGAAGTMPSTVTGAAGEWRRLVNYVINADKDVQALYDNWKFQRTAYSAEVVAGAATRVAPDRIKMWDFDTFKIREAGDSAGDEYPIEAVEYDAVKGETFDITEGVPSRIIVMPDNSLVLEQVPDAAHRILADYYVHPTPMSVDASTSVIPSYYHDVILGRAIQKYANFEGAGNLSNEALELYGLWLPRLEGNQLWNQRHSRFRTGGGFEVIGSQ
jgi:hypothetical protein